MATAAIADHGISWHGTLLRLCPCEGMYRYAEAPVEAPIIDRKPSSDARASRTSAGTQNIHGCTGSVRQLMGIHITLLVTSQGPILSDLDLL